jgi:phage terminase large subunit GpA-like protein
MYVVCVKCGREFAYDWDEMRIVTNEKEFVHTHAAVQAELRS